MRNSFGRLEALHREFQDDYINPVIDINTEIVKSGVQPDGVLSYSIAKHGIERNRVMRADELLETAKQFLDKDTYINILKWKNEAGKDYSMDSLMDELRIQNLGREAYDTIEGKMTGLSNKDYSGLKPFGPELL